MIQTQHLRFCYPGGFALDFPDIEVKQGAVLLLSGPSGCGKSTWLALVAALMPPTSGQLTVAEQALHTLSHKGADAWRARTIGFLPQKLYLSDALTVRQNLLMAQWAAGQPDDEPRITSVLHELDVDALADRKPGQLSGGQAQRVALARAVLLQPRVLLADEPTASLDDENAAMAVHLLLKTAKLHQATLVIATHDARVAGFIPEASEGQVGYQALRLLRSQPLEA